MRSNFKQSYQERALIMCGIAGFIEYRNVRARESDLLNMRSCLRHRGPDDEGHFFKSGVGLAHTRLSILDLSSCGHQPMRLGALVLIYNGEIYNFRELRNELQNLGHQFSSGSDTEVILRGYVQWGEEILGRLDGMFAFAIYSEESGQLFMGRDKAGIKPLIYYCDEHCIVFASELKALKAYPGFTKTISSQGLSDYLTLGYTTGRDTIFSNCFRLLPGECIHVDSRRGVVKRSKYWTARFLQDKSFDFQTAKSQLKPLLTNEFQKSLVSDVPVGVCISGGVDSNVLAAILSKEHGLRLRTYSLGGADVRFNENKRAEEVAKYLKTDHRSLVFDQSQAAELLLNTISHYDEPMADQNILSMRIIARQSKADGIKVLFSGLGGDELFFGYPSVEKMVQLQKFYAIPEAVRKILPRLKSSSFTYKATHLAQQKDYHAGLRSMWNCFFEDETEELVLKQPKRADYFKDIYDDQRANRSDTYEALMAIHFISYLADNGLALSDMSAMAEGVEVRVPYLNPPIVDFALKVPYAIKKHNGEFKALLRSIERDYLPNTMTIRGKQGFYPFSKDAWLKGPLRDLVETYLSEKHIKRQGLFNHDVIANNLNLYRKSNINMTGKLWNMLVFQLWMERHL
jgi:asparagine synthase (glutamine-hydrolysing)